MISCTRVGGEWWDDKIYFLSTIRIYSYFSFIFFYCAKEGWVVENIESALATSKIVTTIQK